jgi:multiple sugar transport system ATP-binding protein
MRLELPRLLRQTGATVLYVTQDYKEAMALADRIAVIAGGKLIQTATPEEIYMKPATLGVARLFGDPSINIADAKVGVNGDEVMVSLGDVKVPVRGGYKVHDGREVTFGVRPESIEIGGAKSAGLAAEVMAVTPLNERIVLLLQSEDGWEFLASLPSSSASIPTSGSKVQINFAGIGIHLFDRETGERLDG